VSLISGDPDGTAAGSGAPRGDRRVNRSEPWPTPVEAMEQVLAAARRLMRADDLHAVLRQAAEVACDVLGYERCAGAWRAGDGAFRYEALVGGTPELWTALTRRRLTDAAFNRLTAAATPIRGVRWLKPGHPVRSDPEVATGLEPTPASGRGGWRTGSLLIVPVVDDDGRVVGFLTPDDPRSGEVPTTSEAVLLDTLAALTAIGVGSMEARQLARRSLAAVEDQRRQLEGLLAASVAVRSHGTLEDVLSEIVAAMTTAAGFERAVVYLLEDPAAFTARATVGLSADEDRRLRATPVPREELAALMRPAMRISRSYLFDHRFFDDVPASLDEKLSIPEADPAWEDGMWHALDTLTVPLEDREGGLIGVLSVDEPWSHRLPDAAAIRLLELFADQCSVAVTEARRYEQAVTAAATDDLTGLANRTAFLDTAGRRLAEAGRRDPGCAVVFMDIDRFKGINDRFGHAAGDDALRALGALLNERLRGGDLVARYGGDEFVALLTDTTAKEAAAIVGELRVRIGALELPALAGERVRLTAGIVQVRPGEGVTEAVDRADASLYVAKHAGRDRIHVG
jgi:diguanylate cyclase (GGDEF)-like protein